MELIMEGLSSKSIIYIIIDKDIIKKLQSFDNAILVIDTIKERLAKRMNGNQPKPLEKMLEK